MINQHLQTATLPGGVATAIVKLLYQDYLYEEIQTILDVSLGSITNWKQAYEQYEINGLCLNYKGRKSYLNVEHREESVKLTLYQ